MDNLSPHARKEGLRLTIEGNWEKAKSAFHAENLVYNRAFRSSPTNKGEVTQSREDEVREPVITERSRERYEEKRIS